MNGCTEPEQRGDAQPFDCKLGRPYLDFQKKEDDLKEQIQTGFWEEDERALLYFNGARLTSVIK